MLPNSWVVIDYNAVDRDVKALPPKIFDDAGGVLITTARRVNAGCVAQRSTGCRGPRRSWCSTTNGSTGPISTTASRATSSRSCARARCSCRARSSRSPRSRFPTTCAARCSSSTRCTTASTRGARWSSVVNAPTSTAPRGCWPPSWYGSPPSPRSRLCRRHRVRVTWCTASCCSTATASTTATSAATLSIYGNVVHATHGETSCRGAREWRRDGAVPAFYPAPVSPHVCLRPDPSGVQSSLEVRVNEVRWPARVSLAELGSTDRGYITRTDDASATTVVFGDGTHGRRLPTGIENVRAGYRNGIGKGGNLDIGRLTQLATKPLGVKDVNNPIPATGGADADSRDQAKVNVPASLKAFDRLVSLADYADFARVFAGVGKATATRLTAGHRRVVFVTVAGVDDIPIDESSDLLVNLRRALHRFGDPDPRGRGRDAAAAARRSDRGGPAPSGLRLGIGRTEPPRGTRGRARLRPPRDRPGPLGERSARDHPAATGRGVGVARLDRRALLRRRPDHTGHALRSRRDTPVPPGTARVVAEEAAVDATGEPVPAQLLYLSATVTDTLTLKEVNR